MLAKIVDSHKKKTNKQILEWKTTDTL